MYVYNCNRVCSCAYVKYGMSPGTPGANDSFIPAVYDSDITTRSKIRKKMCTASQFHDFKYIQRDVTNSYSY